MGKGESIIPIERIERSIYLVRGVKVMFDSDLAGLYGVETKALNRAVRRNTERFPADFMFQLTRQEVVNLRCQIGTSSSRYGGRRYLPLVFTEQGVAMLSSVLNSPRAVQVNIAIIRVFVHLRQFLATHAEIGRKLQDHDKQIHALFEVLHQLLNPSAPPRKQIGFHVRERRAKYQVKRTNRLHPRGIRQ